MKWFGLFLLFVVGFSVAHAQQCTFDYYNKKGGHYLFSTYFNDQNKPREGVCEQSVGTQVYEKRVFQNGHIVSEELNHYNDGKFTPRTRTTLNHHAKKGKPIGELKQFNDKGTLIYTGNSITMKVVDDATRVQNFTRTVNCASFKNTLSFDSVKLIPSIERTILLIPLMILVIQA